jgi:hypothetical protein
MMHLSHPLEPLSYAYDLFPLAAAFGDVSEDDLPPLEAGSDNEPADEHEDDPVDEPEDDPVDDPVDEPADEPADEPEDEPADEPADEPEDEPADEPEAAGSEDVGPADEPEAAGPEVVGPEDVCPLPIAPPPYDARQVPVDNNRIIVNLTEILDGIWRHRFTNSNANTEACLVMYRQDIIQYLRHIVENYDNSYSNLYFGLVCRLLEIATDYRLNYNAELAQHLYNALQRLVLNIDDRQRSSVRQLIGQYVIRSNLMNENADLFRDFGSFVVRF